jgi:hypothetical protein
MSDTPRTNARVKQMIDNDQGPEGLEYWARELERELNAANERIKRLEEAGDTMASAYRQICYDAYDDQQVDNWFKAKEAKP